MAYPTGVFKGMGLWRANSITERDAISSAEKLLVGEHCLVDADGLFVCTAVTATASTWISIASGSGGGGGTFDAALYQGFASGSLQWNSTTWESISAVANIEDVIVDGISRTDNQFTFVSSGYYRVDALFNALGIDNYLGFRVTSSVGTTVLQQTDYINMIGQHRANLAGIFEVTGSGDWMALEYA